MTSSRNAPRHPLQARRQTLLGGLGVIVALAVAGCDDKAEGQGANQGPPPTVSVVSLRPEPVTLNTTLPGRTAAFEVAEIRPQVGGVVRERRFREGQAVKAGDPLFQIDPAPYRAALASAEAALDRAEAALGQARVTVTRYRPLVQQNAVSRLDYDNAVATQRQAEADVASGRASVQTARINLGYTNITSPIEGRTGRAAVTVGALVTADQTASLMTVTRLDPIYVDVTQPSSTLLRLRRDMESGRLRRASDTAAEVRLLMEDGTEYARPGQLQVSEVTVEPTTGAVTLRAVFPNPDGLLMPGMFVRARLAEGVSDALLVPQQAVTRNYRGRAVAKVVVADGTVQERVLEAGQALGTRWVVNAGLQPNDRVIVQGGQNVQPGAKPGIEEITLEELDRRSRRPAPGQQPQGQGQGQGEGGGEGTGDQPQAREGAPAAPRQG
ncbi:efflux RND transporter periplasmic adaptor subunit [Pararoseomonas sp. SCSIO 73927]|uniref:efflux RND transporter periplasmic adaptor subunit n=1 Tax=Pararoseomonas sp. SCSIO 73927 TaxID=3114537 RepID=UPI0030CB7A47